MKLPREIETHVGLVRIDEINTYQDDAKKRLSFKRELVREDFEVKILLKVEGTEDDIEYFFGGVNATGGTLLLKLEEGEGKTLEDFQEPVEDSE